MILRIERVQSTTSEADPIPLEKGNSMEEWNVVINLNERWVREAYKKLVPLEKTGTPGHITFENPDAIIVVKTIAQRAGLSLLSREDFGIIRL